MKTPGFRAAGGVPAASKTKLSEAAACERSGAKEPTVPPRPLPNLRAIHPLPHWFKSFISRRRCRALIQRTVPTVQSPGLPPPSVYPPGLLLPRHRTHPLSLPPAWKPPRPSRARSRGALRAATRAVPPCPTAPRTRLWRAFATEPRRLVSRACWLRHPPHGWRWNTCLAAPAMALAVVRLHTPAPAGLLTPSSRTPNLVSPPCQRRKLATHPRAAPGS